MGANILSPRRGRLDKPCIDARVSLPVPIISLVDEVKDFRTSGPNKETSGQASTLAAAAAAQGGMHVEAATLALRCGLTKPRTKDGAN